MSTSEYTYTHYYIITVRPRIGAEVVEHLKWEDLPWEVRLKWGWYFDYRAALLKIKYPRFRVDSSWGPMPPSPKSAEQIRKNKITALKGKITEIENKLALAEKHWNDLFPIQDYPDYQKALQKLNSTKFELNNLITPNETSTNI